QRRRDDERREEERHAHHHHQLDQARRGRYHQAPVDTPVEQLEEHHQARAHEHNDQRERPEQTEELAEDELPARHRLREDVQDGSAAELFREHVDADDGGDDDSRERQAHQAEVLHELHLVADRGGAEERRHHDHHAREGEDRVEELVAQRLAGGVEGDRADLHSPPSRTCSSRRSSSEARTGVRLSTTPLVLRTASRALATASRPGRRTRHIGPSATAGAAAMRSRRARVSAEMLRTARRYASAPVGARRSTTSRSLPPARTPTRLQRASASGRMWEEKMIVVPACCWAWMSSRIWTRPAGS